MYHKTAFEAVDIDEQVLSFSDRRI
jgi:hypothetical protein